MDVWLQITLATILAALAQYTRQELRPKPFIPRIRRANVLAAALVAGAVCGVLVEQDRTGPFTNMAVGILIGFLGERAVEVLVSLLEGRLGLKILKKGGDDDASSNPGGGGGGSGERG